MNIEKTAFRRFFCIDDVFCKKISLLRGLPLNKFCFLARQEVFFVSEVCLFPTRFAVYLPKVRSALPRQTLSASLG